MASQGSRFPADIPLQRGAHASLGSEGLGVFQAFSLVLLLLLLAAWILRRWRITQSGARQSSVPGKSAKWPSWLIGPAPANQVQVLESRQLTPKASLHLVRWDGREWLVGCADRGIQVIGQRPGGDTNPGMAPGSQEQA